ncbi:hypothetical protein V6N13_087983 [Hibiscus sabdariffa]|uniref:Uncharacterized protein n=1 Tax=Hibiscus sabdariffa TaxID=183260 RepID=A0ABR2FXX9_9ROSI
MSWSKLPASTLGSMSNQQTGMLLSVVGVIDPDRERLVRFMKVHEVALEKWFRNVQEWSEELPDCNHHAWVSYRVWWCADEKESDSFTLDDAIENQKLNDEFKGQGEESTESSAENLVVDKIREGKQSLRADVEHLEAIVVLSENVLCQDERVTNVTLNVL